MVYWLQGGVSGHINHSAVANAVANAAERGRLLRVNGRPARLFQLQTTGVIRKFLGLLDIFMSASEKHLFLAPAGGFGAVWKAMQSHESQFVWYRRLFVATSRYTYINTFTEVKPTSAVLAALAVKAVKEEEEEYSEDEIDPKYERKVKPVKGAISVPCPRTSRHFLLLSWRVLDSFSVGSGRCRRWQEDFG